MRRYCKHCISRLSHPSVLQSKTEHVVEGYVKASTIVCVVIDDRLAPNDRILLFVHSIEENVQTVAPTISLDGIVMSYANMDHSSAQKLDMNDACCLWNIDQCPILFACELDMNDVYCPRNIDHARYCSHVNSI